MPVSFSTPERCLLAQAAHWFLDRTKVPLPDDIYRRAPVELKAENSKLRDLFLALQAEDCDVRGRVVVVFRKYERGPFDEQPKETESSLNWPTLPSNKIDIEKVWLREIDFSNSKISFDIFIFGELKLSNFTLDEITWEKYDFIRSQYPEGEGWWHDFSFGDVTLNFPKLRASLSDANESMPSPAERHAPQTINQERLCERWLFDLMLGGKPPEMPKADYFKEAKKNFSVSRRGFDRAWGNALSKSDNADWSKPGRKS